MKKIISVVVIVLSLVGLSLSFAGCLPLAVSPVPVKSTGDLDIVAEAWDILFKEYVEKDNLDADELSQGAIRGILEALDDPYSAYLEPEEYQLSFTDFEGEYDGIGAHVAMQDDEIVIIAPIPDSPADKAGIRAGDKILEVDGKSTQDMNLIEVVLLVRGEQGLPVKLLILHEGETEPVEVEIVRGEIEVESVYFEMMEDIAYINITHFSERTDAELLSVLDSLPGTGAVGIILDLRSNPGGILTTVVDVTSRFLTEGIVLDVVNNQGEHSSLPVVAQDVTTDLPVVMLVDEFSASGSEVLAGALQDYDRAVVAGTTTFGKGSVNMMHRLSDGSGIYITIGRWLTPEGRLIEGKGVTPDYEISVEGDEPVSWAISYLKGGE